MAIGPAFIAKLLPALDELEERWRTKKISPDKAIDFGHRCLGRLGMRPEFEAYRQRVRVTVDAAFEVLKSSPEYIRRDIDELERRWARNDNDNYRDDFEECTVLIGRTERGSELRARVLAVLASVLAEAEQAATTSAEIREYLGANLDPKRWKKLAGEKLPAPRPRAAFKKARATKKAVRETTPKSSTGAKRRARS